MNISCFKKLIALFTSYQLLSISGHISLASKVMYHSQFMQVGSNNFCTLQVLVWRAFPQYFI